MTGDRAWVGLGRAVAGALLFGLPLLMTMEMWHLGFYMEPLRVALLFAVSLPVLAVLSYFVGFEDNPDWRDDVRDAFIALAIGIGAGLVVLTLLAVLGPGQSFRELQGKVALQAIPGSFGALLARAQLGNTQDRQQKEQQMDRCGYWGELFLMAAGAIYLAFNVAPIDEVVLLAHQMSHAHAIAVAVVSIGIIHLFVYRLGFAGSHEASGLSAGALVARFSLPGYAIVIGVCWYLLWTFGRSDGMALAETVKTCIVLGFPAALGAAVARLVL